MSTAAAICSKCEFACDKPRRGPCACKASGLDILVHIARKDCPKGFHANASDSRDVNGTYTLTREFGVGDALAWLLSWFIAPRNGCGCAKRRAWLNRVCPRWSLKNRAP
jgi:hypothetical protein